MMRKLLLIVFFSFSLISISFSGSAKAAEWSTYFTDGALRFDYRQGGGCVRGDGGGTVDGSGVKLYFDRVLAESVWAGARSLPTFSSSDSNFNSCHILGNQLVRVFDARSGKLIFQQGYNTLFAEWLTTPEADSVRRSYAESVVMPMPRAAVVVELLVRDRAGRFQSKLRHRVEPDKVFSSTGDFVTGGGYPVFDVHHSGKPSECFDIVLLGEGYLPSQRDLFEADCAVFARVVLGAEPFKSRSGRINIRGVWSPSENEGATSPVDDIYISTAIGSSYNTFGMDRYIMVEDFQRVRTVAASAPYDVIYILANTHKYGGGAIYNFYGISATRQQGVEAVYLHELGHLIAGLGDEYQGDVSYDGAYPSSVEPWEYNLTTLHSFSADSCSSKALWRSMLGGYSDAESPLVTGHDYRVAGQSVGVYQGGGYVDFGVYRPASGCMMRDLNDYCPVCRAALAVVMDGYIVRGSGKR